MKTLYLRSRIPRLLLLVAATVQAAYAADDALTLKDAVALAMRNAPQVAASQAAIEGEQAMALSAGRLPDPELVAGVDNLPTNGPDAYSLGNDFMTMRKVGVMQSFPSGPKREAQRRRAAASVSVAESEAAQVRLEAAQSAADAWVSVYAAEVALQGLQDLKTDLNLQAEAGSAAVAGGRATAFDALSAQAAVADLDDRILQASRDLEVSRANLRRWAGESADRPLAAPPEFGNLPADREEILATLHHHAELQTYDSRIAVARSEVAVANADKHPDWSAELDYARRGAAYSDMVSLEFRVALPLWPHYRQNPVIRGQQAAVRKLEAERAAALKMHSAEVTQMLENWETARDRLELYERVRLPLAHQRSQLALASYQAGRMDLRPTLASFADEIELRRTRAELLGSLGHAWAFLSYLSFPGDAP